MPDVLELLYVDADDKAMSRVRKHAAFRPLLDQARREPAVVALPASRAKAEDERDAAFLLAHGAPMNGEAIARAARDAVRDDGKFAPPVVLVEGELALPFDELSTLKAAVSVATPFAGVDAPLKSALDDAKELIAEADLPMSSAVVESWTGRIRDAFAKGRRAVRPGYFDEQIERAMTVERRHQLRSFDGKPCVRGQLTPSGDGSACLAYVPPEVVSRLPLAAKSAVRALGIVHVATDDQEAERTALCIVAIARRVAIP